MPILRYLTLLLAGIVSLSANPFLEAEHSFLQQLNAISGIELGGGPFHTSEHHHFDGESGYFALTPAVPIPTLDQRLTVQTRKIELLRKSIPTNSPPIATHPYAHDHSLARADRDEIFTTLAHYGFALSRDEITALDINTVQIRPVLHLPVLKLTAFSRTNSAGTNTYKHTNTPHLTAEVLLGAQPWLGMPWYRLSFHHRQDLDLRLLQNGPASLYGSEIPRRHPFLPPQSFFAEPGLPPEAWQKVLQNFSAIQLPPAEIIEATISDLSVTLSLDSDRPPLPQQWVKLEKKNDRWVILQAVEFRAEFPRPAVWWSFLPLLPPAASASQIDFPDSQIPADIRLSITSLVSRLRGVGKIVAIDSTDNHQTILVRTSYLPKHSYKLLFTRHDDRWRFFSVYYSSDR
jgi:hypothetical protein